MKKLCVIFGGASPEHDISIITGMQLAKNYPQSIEKIYLGLDNRFYLATKVNDLAYFDDKNSIKLKEIIILHGAIYLKGLMLKKYCDIDTVINCCHGGVGENGDLYGFFAVNDIKCTGADSLSSHIAMDKSLAKEILKDVVPTVKGIKVTRENLEVSIKIINDTFSHQLIVKPNSLGSSIGVKACDKKNYLEQIEAIFEMYDDALVEERIVDMAEYNQACFADIDGLMLSAIENPITKSNFLTFEDKYDNHDKVKGVDRILPARISPELEEKIINYTSEIYKKLNVSGVVRIDYIYDKATDQLYFNEINTIPGSMAFYLYEPIGIDYITLMEKIVANTKEIKKYSYFNTGVLAKKLI
ncbi:MAG: hypothetical protein E7351_03380 [Clostridiales bacterium]|nr:hypothetical protein [Clostridiales bacterium]